MKYFFFILVFASSLLYGSPVHAQGDSSFVLVRTYQGDITAAAIDHLENLYIVSSSGQVRKFNSAGDSLAVYNQLRNFGKLHTIDVSNPLKILLFYKDFSTIVVLDRFLASLATIDLRRSNILQPGAIGLSYDNNIWVFDEYDNKLKKIDESGTVVSESPDFRTALDQSLTPQRIINDNSFVYLADSTNGIFVFDNYGSFKRKVPLTNWQSIAVNNNIITSTGKDAITVFNTTTLLQTQKKLPAFKPYIHAFTSQGKFVGLSAGSLQVYQYRF
ncbi:MAG TPA: hypothetical protein VFR58_01770 [Flavisolibacter sp.]|nr:hypothetical protein [Flavisolibacter sp.]